MRNFNAETRPSTLAPEVVEAAMERAHRLRSEAMRDLVARLGRALRAAARRDVLSLLTGANGPCEPAPAPARGHAAPGWRAALRTRGWAVNARCDTS